MHSLSAITGFPLAITYFCECKQGLWLHSLSSRDEFDQLISLSSITLTLLSLPPLTIIYIQRIIFRGRGRTYFSHFDGAGKWVQLITTKSPLAFPEKKDKNHPFFIDSEWPSSGLIKMMCSIREVINPTPLSILNNPFA